MINPQELLLIAPPLLLALTVHEYSHGYVAYRLGDDTAYRAGRLTLNPLSHLDLMGTLMMLFAMFGWAKPVPINPHNFRNIPQGIVLTSAAGPISNIIIAILSAIILGFWREDLQTGGFLSQAAVPLMMLQYSVILNVNLAIFNLIPVPPLDGSKILMYMLKGKAAYSYAKFARHGSMVLLGLLILSYFTNFHFFWFLSSPFISFIFKTFTGI